MKKPFHALVLIISLISMATAARAQTPQWNYNSAPIAGDQCYVSGPQTDGAGGSAWVIRAWTGDDYAFRVLWLNKSGGLVLSRNFALQASQTPDFHYPPSVEIIRFTRSELVVKRSWRTWEWPSETGHQALHRFQLVLGHVTSHEVQLPEGTDVQVGCGPVGAADKLGIFLSSVTALPEAYQGAPLTNVVTVVRYSNR